MTLTISSREIRAGSHDHLIVTATSSDRWLLPDEGITIEVDGARRTLSFSPAEGRTVTAVVTATVDDAYATWDVRFRVAIGAALPGEALEQPEPKRVGLSERRRSFGLMRLGCPRRRRSDAKEL